jgi:hypothetical protein
MISGSFLSLKSSLATTLADRLNVANVLSTELIKVMMSNLGINDNLQLKDKNSFDGPFLENFINTSRQVGFFWGKMN